MITKKRTDHNFIIEDIDLPKLTYYNFYKNIEKMMEETMMVYKSADRNRRQYANKNEGGLR